MLKKQLFGAALMFFIACAAYTQQPAAWKIAGNHILTPWAASVDPDRPLPEYPRPQMQRAQWTNLNGLWEYAVRPLETGVPAAFDGRILVPFAVESVLSGVGKTVGADQLLWYRRFFEAPALPSGNRLLLHFGAVDWHTVVWVNGQKIGTHDGGYTPFFFDITPFLKKGKQEILVQVWDPTDEGPQPRGKQVKKPGGIWYTSVTGIWQTVWLETVPASRVANVLPEADIDHNLLKIKTFISDAQPGDQLNVRLMEAGQLIAEQNVQAGNDVVFSIAEPKLWSPDNPFLYDLDIRLMRKGAALDEVRSYAAMRKISIAPDQNGVQRLMLNNKFLFQFGLLDQGWWPDGLYTAPGDEALRYDIEQYKQMGFNLLRKHVKTEPARWYYHCDRLGMLVWQDMPSGDIRPDNVWITNAAEMPAENTRTPESETIYRRELQDMVDALRFFPSIVTWVPFNEGWGQFKTEEITSRLMQYDPLRLVNCASGGNFFLAGHIHDFHNYPPPVLHRADLFGQKRALVLGEFGGLGLPLEGHTWQEKANWGYQSFPDAGALATEYEKFVGMIREFIPKGLSGAIYTQVSDVEIEVNGLMSYDRKVIKVPVERMRKMNEMVFGR